MRLTVKIQVRHGRNGVRRKLVRGFSTQHPALVVTPNQPTDYFLGMLRANSRVRGYRITHKFSGRGLPMFGKLDIYGFPTVASARAAVAELITLPVSWCFHSTRNQTAALKALPEAFKARYWDIMGRKDGA